MANLIQVTVHVDENGREIPAGEARQINVENILIAEPHTNADIAAVNSIVDLKNAYMGRRGQIQIAEAATAVTTAANAETIAT